jgi:hypothetical protein
MDPKPPKHATLIVAEERRAPVVFREAAIGEDATASLVEQRCQPCRRV